MLFGMVKRALIESNELQYVILYRISGVLSRKFQLDFTFEIELQMKILENTAVLQKYT